MDYFEKIWLEAIIELVSINKETISRILPRYKLLKSQVQVLNSLVNENSKEQLKILYETIKNELYKNIGVKNEINNYINWNLTFLFGSGLSKYICQDFPAWNDLANETSYLKTYNLFFDNNSLFYNASLFSNKYDVDLFLEKVTNKEKTKEGVKNSPFTVSINNIDKLLPNLVLTSTNYDNLLNLVYEKEDSIVNDVLKKTNFTFDEKHLYNKIHHLHGYNKSDKILNFNDYKEMWRLDSNLENKNNFFLRMNEFFKFLNSRKNIVIIFGHSFSETHLWNFYVNETNEVFYFDNFSEKIKTNEDNSILNYDELFFKKTHNNLSIYEIQKKFIETIKTNTGINLIPAFVFLPKNNSNHKRLFLKLSRDFFWIFIEKMVSELVLNNRKLILDTIPALESDFFKKILCDLKNVSSDNEFEEIIKDRVINHNINDDLTPFLVNNIEISRNISKNVFDFLINKRVLQIRSLLESLSIDSNNRIQNFFLNYARKNFEKVKDSLLNIDSTIIKMYIQKYGYDEIIFYVFFVNQDRNYEIWFYEFNDNNVDIEKEFKSIVKSWKLCSSLNSKYKLIYYTSLFFDKKRADQTNFFTSDIFKKSNIFKEILKNVKEFIDYISSTTINEERINRWMKLIDLLVKENPEFKKQIIILMNSNDLNKHSQNIFILSSIYKRNINEFKDSNISQKNIEQFEKIQSIEEMRTSFHISKIDDIWNIKKMTNEQLFKKWFSINNVDEYPYIFLNQKIFNLLLDDFILLMDGKENLNNIVKKVKEKWNINFGFSIIKRRIKNNLLDTYLITDEFMKILRQKINTIQDVLNFYNIFPNKRINFLYEIMSEDISNVYKIYDIKSNVHSLSLIKESLYGILSQDIYLNVNNQFQKNILNIIFKNKKLLTTIFNKLDLESWNVSYSYKYNISTANRIEWIYNRIFKNKKSSNFLERILHRQLSDKNEIILPSELTQDNYKELVNEINSNNIYQTNFHVFFQKSLCLEMNKINHKYWLENWTNTFEIDSYYHIDTFELLSTQILDEWVDVNKDKDFFTKLINQWISLFLSKSHIFININNSDDKNHFQKSREVIDYILKLDSSWNSIFNVINYENLIDYKELKSSISYYSYNPKNQSIFKLLKKVDSNNKSLFKRYNIDIKIKEK